MELNTHLQPLVNSANKEATAERRGEEAALS